ncbi:MAG: [FeFe] hydrogenase H-cluster maturation GTPase HydF [Clostridiales bacterium]|nr:[FeFe] hydrogenase H-cluster maturation GTPase HydF [Clostridiales bacterium]
MGMNDTPSGERIHIGFFGCRNAGKSSLVNAVTGQEISVVSNVKGTTTDPVKKAMELLPLGPVMIIDTPGYDDEGGLGDKRVYAAKKILRICDIAVLVTVAGTSLNSIENELIALFKQRNIPYIIVKNNADLLSADYNDSKNTVYTSAVKKIGIEKLKNTIGKAFSFKKENNLAGDLIKNGDIAVLVTPIDSAAPKGRLILPQQQVIRDIIENGGIAVVSVETELKNALSKLLVSPSIVITDSQVFEKVSKIVPENIPLTSFSILMARYKGFLKTAVSGARKINELKNGSNVLISEECTHHRQCDDIGTVKLPKWLMEYTKAKLNLEWSSGSSFPQDLSKYDLIIHCGGCMLNANEIEYRMKLAAEFEVPFTNYGAAIAFMKGILERSVAVIPEIE